MYERRFIGFEQRLVKVNTSGELLRTVSSGSTVRHPLLNI